jgi:hypothetical protein
MEAGSRRWQSELRRRVVRCPQAERMIVFTASGNAMLGVPLPASKPRSTVGKEVAA